MYEDFPLDATDIEEAWAKNQAKQLTSEAFVEVEYSMNDPDLLSKEVSVEDKYSKGDKHYAAEYFSKPNDVLDIRRLTQSAYDSLGTKDANTLYLIVG